MDNSQEKSFNFKENKNKVELERIESSRFEELDSESNIEDHNPKPLLPSIQKNKKPRRFKVLRKKSDGKINNNKYPVYLRYKSIGIISRKSQTQSVNELINQSKKRIQEEVNKNDKKCHKLDEIVNSKSKELKINQSSNDDKGSCTSVKKFLKSLDESPLLKSLEKQNSFGKVSISNIKSPFIRRSNRNDSNKSKMSLNGKYGSSIQISENGEKIFVFNQGTSSINFDKIDKMKFSSPPQRDLLKWVRKSSFSPLNSNKNNSRRKKRFYSEKKISRPLDKPFKINPIKIVQESSASAIEDI